MRDTECSLSRHLFIIGVRSGERGVRLHHEEDGAGEGDLMNACCDQLTFYMILFRIYSIYFIRQDLEGKCKWIFQNSLLFLVSFD